MAYAITSASSSTLTSSHSNSENQYRIATPVMDPRPHPLRGSEPPLMTRGVSSIARLLAQVGYYPPVLAQWYAALRAAEASDDTLLMTAQEVTLAGSGQESHMRSYKE